MELNFSLKDRKFINNNKITLPKFGTGTENIPTNSLYSSLRMGQYNVDDDLFTGGEGTNLPEIVVRRNNKFQIPTISNLFGPSKLETPDLKIKGSLIDAGAGGVKHNTPHSTSGILEQQDNAADKKSKLSGIAGNAANVLTGAMGLWSLGNQISEGSKARINPEEMLMKYGTSNTNIGNGFSYERQNNIDTSSEMDQVKAETNQTTMGMAMTGMSTGAAVGSLLGPVGGAVGGAIGGIAGAIGGLFGGASRRRKEEERLRRANILANATTNENRQRAFTEKMLKLVANKYGNQEDQLLYAAKGKDSVDPITNLTYKNFIVDTAFGKLYMPQNAWGSKGEWIESGNTGALHKINHGKNDTARIHVDDNDTIYSAKLLNPVTGNKIANDVPAYAAAGKLDELKMIQRNQRNSKKLRSFADGDEFIAAAEQERARQRNIAKAYLNAGPSLCNIYNAAGAFIKSLPVIGVTASDMNPYMLTGVAPTPGKVQYNPSQMKEYWIKHGQYFAKDNGLSTFMGTNGKMYAKMPDGKVRTFEAIGKEIKGEKPIEYYPEKLKPIKRSVPSGERTALRNIMTGDVEIRYSGQPTANDLEGFARGAEWIGNAIPALTGFGIGLQQYNLAANQDIYKPNSFKLNEYKGALNELDKLHIDYLPIANEQRAAEARNVRTLFNSGGLSTGLRATNLIGANLNTQNAIANGLMNWQKWNNELRSAAAQARLNVGQQEAQRRQQAEQWDADTYAKAHAARELQKNMGWYNMLNALEQYTANEFKRNQFNRTMDLYEQENQLKWQELWNKMGKGSSSPAMVGGPINAYQEQDRLNSTLSTALSEGRLKGTALDPTVEIDPLPKMPATIDADFGMMDKLHPLKLGAKGDRVKTLQDRLNLLNKNNKAWTPLNSGIYDKATKNAVRQFQMSQFKGKKNSKRWDGIYGINTRNALMRALNPFNIGGI